MRCYIIWDCRYPMILTEEFSLKCFAKTAPSVIHPLDEVITKNLGEPRARRLVAKEIECQEAKKTKDHHPISEREKRKSKIDLDL